MALHTLGTNANNSLPCLAAWQNSGAGLTDADIAAISDSITDDGLIASVSGGGSPGPAAILATGTTHSNTTVDGMVVVATTPAGSPLTAIVPGMMVLGVGIPPGTFVASVSASNSIVLSQAATASAAGVSIALIPQDRIRPKLSRTGQLFVPRRGMLQLWPGDIVAIDNIGAVVVVPGASIGYGGSLWTLT